MNGDALANQLDQALDRLFAGQPPAADVVLAGLLATTQGLEDLPSEGFKDRLWADLERKIAMTPANVPAGYRNLVPFLMVPDVDQMLGFLTGAFGAELVHKSGQKEPFPHDYAQVRVGDTTLMMSSPHDPARPTALHLYVDGVDDAYRRAIGAGAKTIGFGEMTGEPADHHYGERSGSVTDPGGNHWYLAERATSKIRHAEMGAVTPYLHPAGAGRLIEFLQRAFGADIVERYEDAGRVAHAKMRIGASILEMGDASPQAPAMPSAFYLYVGDVDAVYGHALAAGATSAEAPRVQPWGDYNAWVTDPFGNEWFISEYRPRGAQ
jgi:uncharacterized glyoxalase superfamily protein PhnB